MTARRKQLGSRRSQPWACSIRPTRMLFLVKLLEPRQPLTVQLASVRALAEGQAAAVAQILLSRLRGFEPSVRAAAIRTLLTRTDWTKVLLEAISRNDRTAA